VTSRAPPPACALPAIRTVQRAPRLAPMSSALTGVKVAIITVSDRSARGEREDTSGPVLAHAFAAVGAQVAGSITPDGADAVEEALRAAIAEGNRIVITTGGTGVGARDRTPEGTARVIETPLPGISERLRQADADSAPGAALSRGLAGLVHGTVIVNVAGSVHAATTAAAVLPLILAHAVAQMDGSDH
jgi:molybdenum cofactor synthesis domain-containing protein